MTPFDVPPPDDGVPPAAVPAAAPMASVPPPLPVTEPLPGDVLGAAVLAGLRRRFDDQRRLAELALAQTSDEAYFGTVGALDPLAVQVKHVSGSLRSRFTDFLTSDGEKKDRDRDREFAIGRGDSREALTAAWDAAWDTTDAAIGALTPTDLGRTVTIRAEPHTVLDALYRALTHVSYHTGQIVLLAKHFAGDGWRTLSVPRGESEAYNAQMRSRFS